MPGAVAAVAVEHEDDGNDFFAVVPVGHEERVGPVRTADLDGLAVEEPGFTAAAPAAGRRVGGVGVSPRSPARCRRVAAVACSRRSAARAAGAGTPPAADQARSRARAPRDRDRGTAQTGKLHRVTMYARTREHPGRERSRAMPKCALARRTAYSTTTTSPAWSVNSMLFGSCERRSA